MDEQQKRTYDTIVARCTDLIPSIHITKHIKPGTLRVADLTLDGITFEAVDPADLSAELSGRMKIPGAGKAPKPGEGALSFDTMRGPRPANALMISMEEDPKRSFGSTVGEGSREQWRPPTAAPAGYGSDRISLGFGETGKRLTFTALHAAVAASVCNVHIDEGGFVVSTPEGAVTII